MRKIVYISICLLLSCTSQYKDSDNTISIASLRNIGGDGRSTLITENITIEGTITANDKYGEFSNSIIIEDQSAAIKILCDMDNIYQTYPFNSQIVMHCNGLYLYKYKGALSLGAEPTSEYTLDYIAQSRLGQYIKSTELKSEIHYPQAITLADLTPHMIFSYVQLDNISISNNKGIITFCQRDPETGRTIDTYHTITDESGNTAELCVDRLCQYSDELLPTKPCTISAIVNYYNSTYSLIVTNSRYKTL